MAASVRNTVYSVCLICKRRKVDGLPFILKCVSVIFIFLLLEGAFVLHRWISTSKLTTIDLEELIPLEEADYKYRRSKLFGETIEYPKPVLETRVVKEEPEAPVVKQGDHDYSTCPVQYSSILFFIRIPKCASTSFVSMMRSMSKKAMFQLIFNPSGAFNWNKKEIEAVVGLLDQQDLGEPTVYARHFYYVDFREYGLERFSYATLIREPISRFISSYLYYHFSSKPHIQKMLKPAHRNESIIQCIAKRHNGCAPNLLTKYFCGHEAFCSSGSRDALKTAKENIKNSFAVVGVIEKMELTLGVFKRVLPYFFSEIIVSSLPVVNKNEHTKQLTLAEEEAVHNANLADIELYDYSLQLLRNLGSSCQVGV